MSSEHYGGEDPGALGPPVTDRLAEIKARRDARKGDRWWYSKDQEMHGCRLCDAKADWFDGIRHREGCPVVTEDQEIDWLIGEVERLRSLLARLEWVPNYQYAADGTTGICPACDSLEGMRHAPDCWLAAELRNDETARHPHTGDTGPEG